MIYFLLCSLLIFIIFLNIKTYEGLNKKESEKKKKEKKKDLDGGDTDDDDNDDDNDDTDGDDTDDDNDDDTDENASTNDNSPTDLNNKLVSANNMMDKILKQGHELNDLLTSESGKTGMNSKHSKKHRRRRKK
jgi:hypothetical protein